MATLAQLRSRISAELDLDNTASGAEQVLIDARCNEAVTEILYKTRCRVGLATMALIAPPDDYTLPTGILAVQRIVDSNDFPLVQTSPEELHQLRRTGATTTTDTTTLRYAVDGANLLMVYPTPSAASTLTVYYVPKPTAMSDGAHDASNATYGGIPSEFHHLIEFYACSRLASYDDDQSSAQGERYTVSFERGIQEMRRRLAQRGERRLSPSQVGG